MTTRPPEAAPPMSFRLAASEADALRTLARDMGMTKSSVVRAGIRALWADRTLFLHAPPPAVGTELLPAAPPPAPRKRGKRGRR